jgi:hypothetical protein
MVAILLSMVAIVSARYIFIFRYKNPATLDDKFWNRCKSLPLNVFFCGLPEQGILECFGMENVGIFYGLLVYFGAI